MPVICAVTFQGTTIEPDLFEPNQTTKKHVGDAGDVGDVGFGVPGDFGLVGVDAVNKPLVCLRSNIIFPFVHEIFCNLTQFLIIHQTQSYTA